MATLVFHLEDEREIVVPLMETVTIGSAEGNDVLVEDGSIAPLHAEVSRSVTGNYVVRDLGGPGGTFVNGRRVKAQPLCEGDEIAFGNLRGRFAMDDEDRAWSEKREEEEREARRRIENVEKEYEDARAKHHMQLGVLQGLGEEEKKRLENLDRLQRAINSAETALSKAEAGVKSAREEAEQIGKLRGESAKLREEIANLTASRDAALAEQRATEAAAQKQLEEQQARNAKQLEDERTLAHQALEKEKAEAKKLFDQQQAAVQRQIKELTSKHEAAQRKLAVTEAQLKEAATTLEEREKALSAARSSFTEAEAKLKELRTSLSACESERKGAEAGKRTAVEAQRAEEEALAKLRQETASASEQLKAVGAKHSAVAATLAALEISVKDMTQRQTQGLRGLREREKTLREALKGLERAESEKAKVAGATQELASQQEGLQKSLETLRAAISDAEGQIAELDEAAGAKNDQIAALTKRVTELERERDTIRARVKTLADTEEHLLKAKKELEKAREEHAAMVVLVAERDARREELDAINVSIRDQSAARAEAERNLAHEQEALAKFRTETAAERQRLTTELDGLEKGVSRKEGELAGLLKQLEDTTQKHEKLLQHSRELAGVEDQLRRARADMAQVQREQTAMAERTVTLTKDSEAATVKLEGLQKQVKDAASVLEKRRNEETAMNRVIAGLQSEQTVESKRLDDIRQAAEEASRKAASEKAEMDTALEKRRREIQAQDDQFHAIQALREEIDALYAQIESESPDQAPALLAAWQEARRKKGELAELLPKGGGIRVRPQVRTVLVPRSKDG